MYHTHLFLMLQGKISRFAPSFLSKQVKEFSVVSILMSYVYFYFILEAPF